MFFCRHIQEFHNSPEWNVTKVYLLGDKLRARVAIHSPLCALGTGNRIQQKKRGHVRFSSALTVPQTTPEMGQYLKT